MVRRVILWVGLLIVGLSATASAQDVMRWESDIAIAQRTAAQTNRLVLVHFGATWCGPCKEMENTVFNQPGLGTALNPYYVGVKIDVDAQPALAKQLQVGPIPCDIVMTPQGQIVARNEGKKPAGEYVAMLNRAAQQARAIQGAAPTTAAPVVSAAAHAMPAAQNAPYSPYAVPAQVPTTSPYAAPSAAAPTSVPATAPTTTASPASMVGSRYSTVYTPPTGAPTTPTNSTVPAQTSASPPTTSMPTIATPAPVAAPNAAATSSLGPRYSATSVGDRYAAMSTTAPATMTAPAAKPVVPSTPAVDTAATTTTAPTVAATTIAKTTPTPVTTSVPGTSPSTTVQAAETTTVGSRYAATSVGDRYAAMPANNSPISTPISTPVPSPVTANTAPQVMKPPVAPPTIATVAPTSIAPPLPASVAAAAPAKPQPMEHSKPLGGPVAPKVDAASEALAELQKQLPPGSPPLALDGYCPVTVTEKMVWKRGDAAFGALHRGMTYLFVSAAEQQKFLAKPDAYSPIISGNDPVAVVEEAKLVPGKRDIGMKCGEQMILFSSKENYEKFRRDQQRYMIGLQQAMQAGGTMRR